MKRKNMYILLLFVSLYANAQEMPIGVSNKFTFPIGSKFTIKLVPKDSVNFDYSVVEFEKYFQVINMEDLKKLFVENGEEDTISFYFCLGTRGDTEEEKKKNMQILLLFKNYSDWQLDYSTDIRREKDFEPTSNVGMFPGIIGIEMWPFVIYDIDIHQIKKHLK